ncbi:PREDICTED: disease resistance RPP13-like protein 4 [Ipomoea nil]|uniref:disease resistance RPP13-like protein 4 n=1 Tax=Ipomoea nil TaxID=35883 RepID=UPI000900BF20|nr:PREDICTED: disease resistance RPP13-like protein 4 [Ipomoea nil]
MACVALTSVISTIELEFLQHTPRVSLRDQAPIKSFFTHLSSLQAFLQESSDGGSSVAAINDLEFKIRDFVLKAEDDIEIQLSNFLLAKDREYQEKALQELHQTLQEAAGKAAVLLNTINSISSEDDETQPPIHWLKHALSQSENGSSRRSLELVGRHGDRTRIINQLMWGSNLKIISIFGMVGIGKTTLAKSIFNDPKVENHFNVRSWITMSQQYNKTHILNLLLRSISPAEEESAPDEELEERYFWKSHIAYY